MEEWTNPEFLQEPETKQGGGTFLVEVKCGVERFQKTHRVAKSRGFRQ